MGGVTFEGGDSGIVVARGIKTVLAVLAGDPAGGLEDGGEERWREGKEGDMGAVKRGGGIVR